MKKLNVFLIVVVLFLSVSCQSVTRQFGGTTNIELEQGEEFINITWKDTNLWVLVEDHNEGHYVFKEYSTMGILQGTVIIKESNKARDSKISGPGKFAPLNITDSITKVATNQQLKLLKRKYLEKVLWIKK